MKLPGKSLGTIGFIAALAFYVAWPLYAGYEIKSSLEAHDAPGLSSRIDFDSVRVSLRPAVAAKVDQVVSDALRKAGTAAGALTDQLKARMMPRIVDGVLAAMVTPEMLIRIHASGTSLKDAIDGMVATRASQAEGLGGFIAVPQGGPLEDIAGKLGIDTGKALGGLFGKKTETKAAPPSEDPLPAKGSGPHKYGIGNIKNFSLTGPLGLTISVARDPAAKKPELTADMQFVDGSWKLTGLVPQL